MSRLSQVPPDAWGAVLPSPELVEDWYRAGRREGLRNGILMTTLAFAVCAALGSWAWFA